MVPTSFDVQNQLPQLTPKRHLLKHERITPLITDPRTQQFSNPADFPDTVTVQ